MRYEATVLIFNLLRQNAMLARFRSSPLEEQERRWMEFDRCLALPGLFELSAETFDQDLTVTIIFNEREEMRDDLLK